MSARVQLVHAVGGSHGSGTWIAANVAGSAGACSHMHWQMTGVMVALPQTDLADNRPIFGAISGAPVWCARSDWWPSGRRWARPPPARRALRWYRPPRNARRPIARFSGIGMVGARPAQTGVPSGGTRRGRRGDGGGPLPRVACLSGWATAAATRVGVAASGRVSGLGIGWHRATSGG